MAGSRLVAVLMDEEFWFLVMVAGGLMLLAIIKAFGG
jgi:hypothetical protein